MHETNTLAMLHQGRDLLGPCEIKIDVKHVPWSASSPSRMTGEVTVMVTTTLGSLVVTTLRAASS